MRVSHLVISPIISLLGAGVLGCCCAGSVFAPPPQPCKSSTTSSAEAQRAVNMVESTWSRPVAHNSPSLPLTTPA